MAHDATYPISGVFASRQLYGRYIAFVALPADSLGRFAHYVCRITMGWLEAELGQVSLCTRTFWLLWGDPYTSWHATFRSWAQTVLAGGHADYVAWVETIWQVGSIILCGFCGAVITHWPFCNRFGWLLWWFCGAVFYLLCKRASFIVLSPLPLVPTPSSLMPVR